MGLQTVLLVVGQSDEGRLHGLTQTTVDIAGPADASVALAHVFTSDEYQQARENLDFEEHSQVTPDAIATRYKTIRELAGSMADAGIDYTEHGRLADEDDVGEQIVSLADAVDADLVVVGGRQRSPTAKAVFGSTAQEILLNAPCPVTFVRDD